MIQGLKAHLFKKRLAEISVSKNKVSAHNAFKNVLLFFDGTDGSERKVIQKYATELERSGKVVKLFAFVNTKEQDSELGINHYVKKDVNWYQVPICEDLRIIQSKSYDVMISLLSNMRPHHQFVIKTINAEMKIGPQLDGAKEVIFDLSVDHHSSLGIPELIKNIKSSIQLLSNGK